MQAVAREASLQVVGMEMVWDAPSQLDASRRNPRLPCRHCRRGWVLQGESDLPHVRDCSPLLRHHGRSFTALAGRRGQDLRGCFWGLHRGPAKDLCRPMDGTMRGSWFQGGIGSTASPPLPSVEKGSGHSPARDWTTETRPRAGTRSRGRLFRDGRGPTSSTTVS